MSTASTTADLAGDDLARFSHQLYARGWMPGTAGNLSVRLPGHADQALITASGRDKGELAATDMVPVEIRTSRSVRSDGLRASAEVTIHTAIYRVTDARAVIHVHSPYATAVACRAPFCDRVSRLRLERYELLKGLGLRDPASTELAVLPNWPNVPRIGADLADQLSRATDPAPGFLIAHHGITVWGSDLAQARNRLECLEAICQQLVLGSTFPFQPMSGSEGEDQ